MKRFCRDDDEEEGACKQSSKNHPILSQVPSLNDVPLHYLKPNSLVKFRCLIQDMFDPEFYMGVYETVDPATKAKVGLPSPPPCSLLCCCLTPLSPVPGPVHPVSDSVLDGWMMLY